MMHVRHIYLRMSVRSFLNLLQRMTLINLQCSNISATTSTFLKLTFALCEMSLSRAISFCRCGSAGRPFVSIYDALTFVLDLDQNILGLHQIWGRIWPVLGLQVRPGPGLKPNVLELEA